MFSVHLCRLRIARKKLNWLRGGIGVTFSFIEYTPQSFWGSPIKRDILSSDRIDCVQICRRQRSVKGKSGKPRKALAIRS